MDSETYIILLSFWLISGIISAIITSGNEDISPFHFLKYLLLGVLGVIPALLSLFNKNRKDTR